MAKLQISFPSSSGCFNTVPELTLPTAPSPTTTPTSKVSVRVWLTNDAIRTFNGLHCDICVVFLRVGS